MQSAHWLSDEEQRTWRALLSMQAKLSAHLNRELQRTADLSLADYDVLVNLSEAVDHRLRVHQLGEVLQWEQSRLSHHLARMQRRDLVAREECPNDRRGAFIGTTEAGLIRLSAAAPAHVETVRQVLFDDLDPHSLHILQRIASRALDRLGATAQS